MKGLLQQILIATTLAIPLATARSACATEASVATEHGVGKAAGSLLAITGAAVSARLPQLQPSLPPLPGSDNPPSAADVQRLLSEEMPAPECTKSCATR